MPGVDDAAVIQLIMGLVEKLGLPAAVGAFGWYQWWTKDKEHVVAIKEKDAAFAAMQTKLLDEQKLLQQKLMELALEQVKVNLKADASMAALRDTLREKA